MSTETRNSILDAALAVYGRAGARGFSMRAVAADVGITATAIYRHYPDKAALGRALLERARQLLGGFLLEGVRGKDALERLWSCADAYVRFAVEHPQLYRLLFLDPLDEALPDLRSLADRREDVPFHFVVDRIREAMDEGIIARTDPMRAGLTVWAHVHGLCALSLAGRLPGESLPQVARESLQTLYEGLRLEKNDGKND
jgi:AcrR family transcriptional regulator